jgi:hypothetical protein
MKKIYLALIVISGIMAMTSIAFSRALGPSEQFSDYPLTHTPLVNLYRIDESLPRAKEMDIEIWSDRLWRYSSGLIAQRYKDFHYNKQLSWRHKHQYTRSGDNSLAAITRIKSDSQVEDAISKLSPAEKYDLWLGDLSGTLTRSIWNEVNEIHENGGISRWMGICEGSAAASIYYPEPQRSVTVKSLYRDLPIEFTILDIKGLASLLLSTYGIDYPTIGTRCRDNSPSYTDLGFADDDCFNINPGAFHVALVNLMGKYETAPVIDVNYDNHAWNLPVLRYQFEYYNIASGKLASTVEEAKVAKGEEPEKKFRANSATHIVGVQMHIVVAKPSWTTSFNKTTPARYVDINYAYDLELDKDGNIVGGEWVSKKHPDFLWYIPKDSIPETLGDRILADNKFDWQPPQMTIEVHKAARESSARLQPMRTLVEYLIMEANRM